MGICSDSTSYYRVFVSLGSDSTSYYRVFGPCLDFSLIPCEEKKAVSVLLDRVGSYPAKKYIPVIKI